MCVDSTIQYYPSREDDKLTFGLPTINSRFAKEKHETHRYRTSIDTAISRTISYDGVGKQTNAKNSFQRLQTGYHLGKMTIAFEMTEKEHEYSVNKAPYLSEEEVEEKLALTPEPESTGLMERYYHKNTRTR